MPSSTRSKLSLTGCSRRTKSSGASWLSACAEVDPPLPALSSPLSDPRPEMMVPAPAGMAPAPEMPLPAPVPMQEQQHRPEPAVTDASSSNMNSVARVLSLAQQTADQAVADARREVDDILGNARRQAKQITRDARTRAESLERDAQERHRQAIGSLPQLREGLERQVDDLRAFEREYRGRLKAYIEGQLRDLEADLTGSDAFPGMVTAQQLSMPGMLPSKSSNSQS